MSKIKDMTLDEKVDELLKYQRRTHHIAIIRAIFSFLIFLIIVVLPIWGFYYMANYLTDVTGLSLSEVGETLNRVKSITDINGLDGLKNLLN